MASSEREMAPDDDPRLASEDTLAEDASSSGANAFPFPPAVDFPYPQRPSNATTTINTQPSNDEALPEQPATAGTLGPSKSVTHRSPAMRAATIDRPRARPRPSFLGLKRGNTTRPSRTIFDPTVWESDDDPSSDDSAGPQSSSPKSTHESRRDPDDALRRFAVGNENYRTKGRVSKKDGRLYISMHDTANKGYLAKSLEATLRHNLGKGGPLREDEERPSLVHAGTTSTLESVKSVTSYVPERIPRLNIVIMVIGSRGDIQPFLRLGKILREEHGHRVRIATHPAFREFVEKDSKVEFFSVGGDPAELMAFMVKNPGLVPKAKTIREGEIARRREAMYEMFKGFWRACISTTDDERDIANLKMMGNRQPFVADAIIANPPSFAHVHCAERLGVPLHLMFTFPTSPTQQFPHPLANIKRSNVDPNYTNFISYPLVEMMTWQGLGDLVNRFRVKSLGLEPISTLWAPGQLYRMRVPHSYLWSPALIPKPPDWGPEIQITGFVFLDLASSFEPAPELVDFLKAGDPPVYIGFGSIVVDDPNKFTALIFEAVQKAGVRALVSKGWGGLGDESNVPPNVFMLGNTPHDWLFPQVSAVVHHGGAGSTAIGLKCGKPTFVVPFFGDQPFWGAMIAKAGAGAEPIPQKRLTADHLTAAIKKLLTPECQGAAKRLAKQIESDGDGAESAVDSFHRALPLRGNHSMRCSILDDRVAVWWLKGSHIRLSALAAEILTQSEKLKWNQLRLVRHYDWNDFEGPGEPVTGAGGAVIHSIAVAAKSLGGTPVRWASTVKHEKGKAKKKRELSQYHVESNTDDEPESTLERHDKKSGKTKRGFLPPANLGEGHLKKEIKKIKTLKLPMKPVPSDVPEEETETAAGDLQHTNSDESNGGQVVSRLAAGTGKGVARTARALARAPVDISVALAQGFHNAPRLWGDETVRTPRRVTGMRSALRAAREEFVFGVSDGVTGLVRHPYHGVKEEGALGLVKGVGKGVGGFVLKDIAAIAGVPAYTLKGLQKEIRKGSQPTDFIRRAHIIEGQKELIVLSSDELRKIGEEVAAGWRIIVTALQEKEMMEKSGIAGRIFVHRRKQKWKEHGVFENVEQMDHAMAAERQGRDFGREFKQHRREIYKAQEVQSPRKAAGGKGPGPSPSKSPRRSADKDVRKSTDTRASRNKTSNDEPTSTQGTGATSRHLNIQEADFGASIVSSPLPHRLPASLRQAESEPDPHIGEPADIQPHESSPAAEAVPKHDTIREVLSL